MTDTEKMELLAEVLEVSAKEIKSDMCLSNMEEWDSMARLSLIVLMEDEFNKKIKRSEVMGYRTINDILEAMESVE